MNKALMLKSGTIVLCIFYVEAMRKYMLGFHIYTKKEGLGLQVVKLTCLKLAVLLREIFQSVP